MYLTILEVKIFIQMICIEGEPEIKRKVRGSKIKKSIVMS